MSRETKKKVMIFGTFDILHSGHFHVFQEARKMGDEVIAIVARDVNVQKVKGRKAFHNERERKFILSHIDFIDKAVLGDKKDVYKVVRKIKPDIILLGYDQVTFVNHLEENLKKNNLHTKVVRAKPLNTRHYKTTKIKEYLNKFL